MKTACCLLVAVLAATCAATTLTLRELEMQQFLLQAKRDGQLNGILNQMMIQYDNNLPQEITKVLTASNLPLPAPVVLPKAPENSKYKFKGMEKLSATELRAVNVFLDEYFKQRDEKLRTFKTPKMNIRTPRQPCRVDDDCPFQQFCFDITEELLKEMSRKGYAKFYDMVITALDLKKKECSPRFGDLMVNDVESYMTVFRSAFDKIKIVVEKSKKINGMTEWIERVEKQMIKPFNFSKIIEEPLAEKRQGYMEQAGGYYPMQQQQMPYPPQQGGYQAYPGQYYAYPQEPYYPPEEPAASSGLDSILPLLLLPMLGGGDTNMESLLPLLLLMGGDGGDISPLLLISVMGMGDGDLFSNGNNFLTIILLTQFLGTGSGMDNILPLLLIMMQGESSDDNSMLMLLPLLLLGGGSDALTRQGVVENIADDIYCPPGGGQNNLIQILLFTTLLDVPSTGTDLNPLLLILLLQPQDGCPGSGIGAIEILLIQSLSGGNMGNIFTGGNSLLPLLVLSGLGSGSGGAIDPSLLLLVLLGGGNNNSTGLGSLLPILFLSDPNFAQDPLAFLLLFNSNLFGTGGSSGDGNNMNLLFLLLFLGQGQAGYQQPITSPYAINQADSSIPPPGGAPAVQQQRGGGLLGGLGGGNGIFTLLLLTNVLGGGNMGSDQLLLFLLISQGGLFNSGSSYYY